ncbi:hypothetical protein RUND412_007794 [Rhizina undulata]
MPPKQRATRRGKRGDKGASQPVAAAGDQGQPIPAGAAPGANSTPAANSGTHATKPTAKPRAKPTKPPAKPRAKPTPKSTTTAAPTGPQILPITLLSIDRVKSDIKDIVKAAFGDEYTAIEGAATVAANSAVEMAFKAGMDVKAVYDYAVDITMDAAEECYEKVFYGDGGEKGKGKGKGKGRKKVGAGMISEEDGDDDE